MHILVPTGIFHPESGGPATYLYHFLPELIKRGHTVEVITYSDDPPQESYPYPVIRVPRTNILHRNWRYYQAVQHRLRYADRVYINSLGLSLPPITKPSVIKIVGDRAWERCINRGWVAPDEDIDHFQTNTYNRLIEWVKTARAKEAQRPDHVIVPSYYLKNMVHGWGVDAENISVVYNAFSPLNIKNTKSRAELGLPQHVPLFLTVARLTPWKGIDKSLLALKGVPHAHLVVIGSGSELAPLKTLAETLGITDRVHFTGQIPHETLGSYYQVADYLLLYSGYEGLSHTILEALSANLPIIASNKGGNPEIVEHGKNGLLVPYPDVNALMTTIERAIDPTVQQQLKARATLNPEAFSWSTLVKQTIALLEADATV